MPEPLNKEVSGPTRRESLIWLGILVLLCLWAAWRMGAFDLMNTVTVDGRRVVVPNTFAPVDHPFHATRAHALLESLKQGEVPRWVGNHQGGYPVEFYPVGIAWLDVALWALLFGTLPIIAVHKIAVIGVFLLPAVGFWLLSRGDRLHPGTAVLATAAHFAIPGHWLNGGYTELVGWGLVTNVAGGSLALIASAALARFVMNRERGMGVLAILAAAAGACTNPRSLFAVVIAALAILIAATVTQGAETARSRLTEAMVRIGIVGGMAALIAAPVVLSLFLYQQHYFFLHYEFYEPITEFWTASSTAATSVIVILSIGGAILPWVARRMSITRTMSLALVGYAVFTIWVATSNWTPPLVEQLEAPRLMPYQRQLMIYLGAVLVGYGVRTLLTRLGKTSRAMWSGVFVGAIALATLIIFIRPLDFVPDTYVGMEEVGKTGNADFAEFTNAVEAGEALRTSGTSLFIIGNRDDWWHEQLWAPTVTDAPLYYDDWMWYWTKTHQGPYDYRNGHYFPNPTYALTPDYLRNNGISVVLVTNMPVPEGMEPRDAARTIPELAYETTVGEWDIYRVREATSIVTNGRETPTEIDVENHLITAHFDDGDGQIVIRRNWFPRWEATVNGEAVDIMHRGDGYMELTVPPGPADVEIHYRVTALDWTSRAAAVVGVVGTFLLAAFGQRLEHRWSPTVEDGTA